MRHKQAGFIVYVAIGALLAVSAASLFGYIQTQRLASCKQEFQAFQAKVKAEGDAAIAEAKRIEAENQAKKVRYDNQIKALRASNAVLSRRVRDSAGQSSLPAASGAAGKPDATACFQRGILDDAIRAFTAGTAAIASEGQQAVDELNNARAWAGNR